MSPKTTNDTTTISAARYRRWAKPTALLTSFVLSIGSLVLGGAAAPPVANAALAGGDPVSHTATAPVWTAVTDWQANWKYELNNKNVYWAADSTNMNSSNAVGTSLTALWQADNWASDLLTYEFRATMSFTKVSSGTTNFDYLSFTSQAIGRIGGTRADPMAPLTVYYWDHFAPRSKGPASCAVGYTPIVRVTSMDPTIYWSCMPAPDDFTAGYNFTGFNQIIGNGNATGGEIDQYTGALYVISSVDGAIDNQGSNSAAQSTENNWVFSIWDPVTGAYSLSGSIQPGDWTPGMTTVPTERVDVRANVDGTGNSDPQAPADFAMDADGNVYVYSGTGLVTGNTGTTCTGSNGNMSLVRMEPARDANGNVVDGTAQNPWRYYVVDKLRKDPAATQYCWSNAQFIWGGAFVHGQFLLAANANIRPHSAYSALAQQWVGTDGGTNGTTGMVKVDPLRGTARPVWSTSNNDIPAGAATGGVNVLDDAGAQLAEVIRGMIYNDANGNGAVDPGEKGIPNVKLGLYDMSGTLVSVKQTDSVGKYSFIVDEEGVSYYVRPVQVQIAAADGTPMNATLTWAAGSTEQGYNNSGVKVTNTATVYCNEGTIATATGGQCSGAKPVGSADPPLGALDSVSSPDQWLNYAKVEINTAQQVPDVSFAFTTVGSYGDAPADPLAGPSVPAHVNGVNVPVWLGAAPGAYAGPVADITAHATDDGVFLKTFLGDAPLNAVAITQAYTLDGVLNGSQAANATVNGWLASGNTWNTTADWTPTITGGVASGPIPPFATTGDVQFRANASAQTQTQPTNASNEYYADSSGAPNWVTTGEIEDYGLTVADAVYRPAAKTTNSTGTFTVANQQIAADATKWTFGNGVPATPGSPVTVTAEVPSNQWVVDTVTVADTVTGAPVAATISAPAANGSVTITYTPTTGSDVTIAVLYAPAIDWTKSTLTLDKESALVGTPITATATVIDVNGDPVVGKVITFANVSDPVTQLSSLTCTTNDQGVCSVTITSNKTGKYPDELSATAVEAGTAKALNGSPASVEFTAGPCNILHSKFTVDPPADPTDTLNHKDWVLVGEPTEPGYTGTLTPLDEFDNLCWPDTVVFSASATTVTITGGTTANADGTYTAKFTSKVATADTTAAVAVDGAQVGKNEPIPFLHKEPDPKPTCDGKTPTNLSVNPSTTAVNTSSTATAYITDMYCNPVGEGYEVFFQASGDATMPVSAMTDKDSNAIALVTDKTAEKVLVHASLPDLADLGAEPTEINLSPQPVTFTPTDCDPNNSRFTITPVVDPADLTRTDWVTVGKPDGGSFYTGTLVPLDEFGNLCKPKAADINFQASPGFVQVGAATPNPDGTWSAKYTSTVASSTSLAWVTLSGAQVQSKLPIPFKADIPVPTCDPAELNPGMECSNLTVDPNSLDIFQKSTATVYLTDRYGNPVGAGATVVFTVNGHATFVPNAQQAYTTTTNTDSKAIVQLTDETGETVQVWGKYDGQDVKDSPADVTFSLPLCSAADSSFAIAPVADPTDPAMKNWVAAGGPNDPGYTGTLKLQSADGVAPCEPTGPIMFKSTEDYVVIGTPVDDGRGTITAKFTSTTASPDPEALVTMGGTQIGTNLPIPFKPGPYSPTCIDPSIKCSGLTVDPTNLPVGSRTTATALLTDQYGNGIGGEPIVLTVNKAATFVDNGLTTITGPTDSSWTATRGTVVVQVTDKTAETVNVAATYQGAGLPNSPVPVTFEVAPCSPEHSLFSVTPVADPADTANMVNWVTVGEPDGTNYYTGTLVPRDEYDNLCKPEAGKVVFQASPGFVMVGAPVANPNGTYSAKYTSKVAAPSAEKPAIPLAWVLLYNVQVQNKEPIPFVHDVEVVNPPEPCADPDLKATNLQVNPASVVIPGASTATAHITDKYCNAVPGVTVTFAVTDSPATTASVTGPSVTDGSGNAKSTVSDTAPETVKVHASIKQDGVDTEIRTSPQPVTFTASRVCDPAASGFAVTPAVDPADPAMTNWVTVGGPTEAGYAGTLTAKNAFGGPCDPISTAFGSTSTDVVVSDVTDNKDGTYTVKFTSTVASATPEAWAKLDGTQVGANKPIPFQAGAIDPDQSSVTANPLTQVVGSPVTVTVTLKDKYGNPVTRVAPAAVNVTGTSGPNTAIVQACVRDATQPGAYLCEMTAKVVGQYKVVAKVEGTTLSQQPVVEFVHGAVCVANCEPVDPNHLTRFDMVANDQEANGTAEDSARAWAYDHYGNVVPDAVVKVVDQSGGALTGLLNPATASALTNNTGTAMVYWTTTRSGVYTGLGTIDDLQPTTSGKDTSGGVLEIRFSPANLSAENSELVVTPASPIRVGDTYTATATIRTTTNELAKDAVVSFGVTTSVTQGWTLSSTTCRTDDNGQCSVTLTAKLVGDDYTISAKIPEAGVATNITGSPKTVAFTAGDVCVENPTTTGPDCDPLDKTHVTRLVVDPNGQEANGSAQDVINVYAYDYYGNPVPDAPVVATAPAALTLRTAVNPLTDTNGIAKVGYTATEPGQYDVPVTVGGKTPPTSPASLSFVQVPVTDLQVAITPTTTQPVGTEFTVTATATDAGGSKVKGAVITFPPVAGATVGASCTTGDDGTCTVMLYSEKPGTYTVEGRTGTLKATDKATYVAGPVDHVAVKTIKNGAMPDGTDQDIYLVTAYDKFDNPVPGATVTSANQSPELTAAAIAKTDQNGQATVAYTANKSGVYDATVKADGVTADIDPIHPTFQTLPADPGKSSWEVSPAGPIIVGKDAANTYTLTAHLRNELGQPVEGAAMTFAINPAGPVFVGGSSCLSAANGDCTVPVHSTKAGTYSVTATINTATANNVAVKSVKGNGFESVVWLADEVCAVKSGCTPDPSTPPELYTRVIVTADNALANGNAQDTAVVYAYDKWGNPVPNALVLSTGDTGLTVQTGIKATNDQGQSTISYTAMAGGAYVANVTVNGKLPTGYDLGAYPNGTANDVGGQITLHFTGVTVPCDPAHSTFTVSPVVDPKDPAMTNWVTVGEPTGPGYTGTLVALSTEDKQCDVTSVEFGSTSGDVTVTRAPDGLANGTYYATFTSTVASATPEALAKLNGAQVGVNKPIPFKSDVPDKSKSKVTVNPPTQVVGSPVTVTVALQDKYGNPVTWIAPADIDVTGESGANAAEVKACVLDAASGTYKCEMTAKLVGDYTVEAVVAGTTLDDHPVVTFTHGAVCVSNCEPVDPNHLTRFDMVTNDQPADGKTKDSAEASAYDHYGNVVPGAAVQVVDQSTGALAGLLTPATATATTGTDGTAMVYWTATRSGRYTGLGTIDGLRPTAAGKDVTGGVLSEIRFSQPDVSAKDSDLVVTPASPIVVGNTYTATATIRTATKELVAGAVVSFGVTTDVTDGWTLSKATCTTISDGTCSVTLTAQLVGDYTISATIPQAGVATGINGSPKTVKFTAGEVCVDNPATTAPECAPLDKTHVTRVTVDPNGAVANGSAPDVINVYAYDYYGNAVANAQVVATALGGLTLATATASPQTGTDGTATIGYTSLDATTYLVPVTVGGKTPPTSPAQLSFVDVPVADLKITISPDGPLPVGDTYTVTATAKDVDGKFVKGAVITFPPVAGATVGASCTTNVDGVCTVTLYSETPGTYTVKGRTGTLEAEDTAVYKVGPVDHATVEVVKNGARPDGVDQDVYRVTAYDKFDNPVPGAAVTSTDQSAELTTLAIAPTNKNGQTTVAYTSTKGGVYDATVKVNDVTAVPTVIHPAFGGPAAGGTWSVTPAGPLVVGRGAANSYTLRASLVDDLNRPAAGSVATFTVNPGGPVFPDGPSCVTDTSGTCTVPVYSTKAGTYSVTADTNGLALKSTNNRYAESVVWTPDEVCTVPSGCTPDPETKPEFYTRVIVTEDKAVANGDAYDVATVYAYDQYGNPVPSALVISTTADAKLTIQQGIPGTDAQGESTIQYTSTKAGEHLAAVTIDGKIPVAYNSVNAYTAGEANPVAGQVTLTFVAGPADPKHSYLTVEPKQQLAYDDVAVTATIADKFDNPVAGVTVAFDVTGNATFGDSEATPVAAVTGTTDANGRAAATLTDATNTEEIVQVSARIDVAGVATDIVNSPTDVTFLPRVLAPCSSLSVNKNELPVGEYATATVNVCDDMLHPVPNVTVTITTDSSTTLVNSSQLTTDSSGNAFLKFTDSEAKVVQVTAKLPDGSEVDNSPEKVTFLDVTAPEPPVITTPKDGTATNKPNVEVTGTGEAGATVTVWDKTDPANPVSVCTAVVDAQGNWKCTTTKLADGDHTLVATQTDPAGNTSGPSNEVNIKIDQTPPGAPVFDRTNGSEVSGSAEPGATVVVTDGNGQPIPGCGPMVADADGRFSCDPTTRLVPGTVVKGTATDPAGNVSAPGQTVVVPLKITSYPERNRLETQVITGENFNPGEQVCLTVDVASFVKQCKLADADGKVTFSYVVTNDFPLGVHTQTLTGAKSGSVSNTFTVTEVAKAPTGGTALPGSAFPYGLLAGGTVMVLAGLWLSPKIRRTSRV